MLRKKLTNSGFDSLIIAYENSQKRLKYVYFGNFFSEVEVKNQPHVLFTEALENKLYTLILLDFDSPVFSYKYTVKHKVNWMSMNIEKDFIFKHEYSMKYIPPVTPLENKIKRYLFLLYLQPKRIDQNISNGNFMAHFQRQSYHQSVELNQFVRSNNLELVAFNFFNYKKTEFNPILPLSDIEQISSTIIPRPMKMNEILSSFYKSNLFNLESEGNRRDHTRNFVTVRRSDICRPDSGTERDLKTQNTPLNDFELRVQFYGNSNVRRPINTKRIFTQEYFILFKNLITIDTFTEKEKQGLVDAVNYLNDVYEFPVQHDIKPPISTLMSDEPAERFLGYSHKVHKNTTSGNYYWNDPCYSIPEQRIYPKAFKPQENILKANRSGLISFKDNRTESKTDNPKEMMTRKRRLIDARKYLNSKNLIEIGKTTFDSDKNRIILALNEPIKELAQKRKEFETHVKYVQNEYQSNLYQDPQKCQPICRQFNIVRRNSTGVEQKKNALTDIIEAIANPDINPKRYDYELERKSKSSVSKFFLDRFTKRSKNEEKEKIRLYNAKNENEDRKKIKKKRKKRNWLSRRRRI